MMACSGGSDEGMDVTEQATSSSSDSTDTVYKSALLPMFKDGVLADTMPDRQINFTVQYSSHNIQLQLPDSETVGQLKNQLEAKLNIPAAQQVLKGLVKQGVDDSMVLRDLFLPRYSVVYLLVREPLIVPCSAASPGRVTVSHRCDEYKLIIQFDGLSLFNIYNLDAKGHQTVGSLKEDISSLTGVPAKNQQWYGFVSEVTDDTSLCDTGIHFPRAEFEVTECTQQIPQPAVEDNASSIAQQSPSKEHDMEVNVIAERDVIHMEDAPLATTTLRPLMSPDTGSEVAAVKQFYQEFRDRYGELHPIFFISSLRDVIWEAFQHDAADRKLLALYLHHDGNVHTNAFCTECLCSETVVNFLCTHFCTWAWDITHSENKAKFLASAAKHFGDQVADMIKGMSNDHFPLVLIMSKIQGSTQVLDIIQGHVSMINFMTRLLHALDVFTEQKKPEVAEDKERKKRERLQQEEEEERAETLRIEMQIKNMEKSLREKEKAKKRYAKRLKKEREWMAREMKIHKRILDEAKARPVPEEPASGTVEGVTTIEFSSREGRFTRRFRLENIVQDLLNFLDARGFPRERYRVMNDYPHYDISGPSPLRTLREAGFSSYMRITLVPRI